MISRLPVIAVAASLALGGYALTGGAAEAKGFASGGFVGGGGRGGFVGGAQFHGRVGRPGFAHVHVGWGHGYGRSGHWNRHGYGRYGFGNRGFGAFGYGGLPIYGSYGLSYAGYAGYSGYSGYPGVEAPYDLRSSQPTVGIAPAPVLPPAIYVIGGDRRGVTVRKGQRVGVRSGTGGRVAVSYGEAATRNRGR